MKIEFYILETGDTINPEGYFVLNGDEVWRDNCNYSESQEASVGFDDFIEPCSDIGWRIV